MIVHPTPPAGGLGIVEKELGRVFAHDALRDEVLDGAELASLQVTDPHGVHTLRASLVRTGMDLADVPRDTWRYLVFSGDAPVAAVELREKEDGSGLGLAHVNTGRIVSETVAAIVTAEADARVDAAPHELRFLRAPELGFLGVWLSGPSDLVVPIDGHSRLLRHGRIHFAHDVVSELVERRARRRL